MWGMNANDVVFYFANPVRPELFYTGFYLSQSRVVVLSVEASRVIDENDVILHRLGKNMPQFHEDGRVVKRLGRLSPE